MRILICGASGFVGLELTRGLRALGHEVVRGVRRPAAQGDIKIDYSLDTEPAIWEPRLVDINAVVNAVGIITERSGASFEDLHQRSPIALFEACARSGVSRVLQISALGADSGDSRYFRTKRAADRALMSLSVEWQVLRPSLVYGEAGTSASAFRLLASLPMIPVPSLPASAQFQPVHIDDLVAAAGIALDPRTRSRQCIDCTGATSHTFRGMLTGYREALRLGSALWLPIPSAVMAIATRFAGLIPGVPLTHETWRMLQRGNAGPSDPFAQFLGRAPREALHRLV
jgi:uncharacterized protein YbjT (DUF2867 family)